MCSGFHVNIIIGETRLNAHMTHFHISPKEIYNDFQWGIYSSNSMFYVQLFLMTMHDRKT